ncbi:MAG: hypothetical protein ACTSRK_01165 [Promethearchaeota archaeon]
MTSQPPGYPPSTQIPVNNYPEAPRDTYGYGFDYQIPFPAVPTDEFGIPLHPFWREYYYRRQLDSNCPIPRYIEPYGSRTEYHVVSPSADHYFKLADVYWRHNIDLRPYPNAPTLNWFLMPLPPASVVSRDTDGIPYNTYWMLWHFIREINPKYAIPPYDNTGLPIFHRDRLEYNRFSQLPLDRSWYIENRATLEVTPFRELNSRHSKGKNVVEPRYLPKLVDWTTRTPPMVATTLACPTVPELATAYITITRLETQKMDQSSQSPLPVNLTLLHNDTHFPNGFTPTHRAWLLACAHLPNISYLENNLPPSDSLLVEIRQKRAKELPHSSYMLL